MKIKNFTLVSFILSTISTISTAFSHSEEIEAPAREIGILELSTGGNNNLTAVPGVGSASYTETGEPCNEFDGASATSFNDLCTDTHEMGIYTAYGTTIVD